MNRALRVEQSSMTDSLVKQCGYISFCPIAERSRKDPCLDDGFYERICMTDGDCKVKDRYDKALENAIERNEASHDFEYTTNIAGLSQVRFDHGFNPNKVYALIVKGGISFSRLVKGSELYDSKRELLSKKLRSQVVVLKGPISLGGRN